MRVEVAFQDEKLDLDVPDGRLVGQWAGPAGLPPEDFARLLADRLEGPSEFPPLRQAVVPGDRIVLALGSALPGMAAVIEGVVEVLALAGVTRSDVTVLIPPGVASPDVRHGLTIEHHDPDDKTKISYLASTAEGRRVYLNRALTDADLVIPIGRLGFDATLGYAGPWSALYPGFSDSETRAAFRALAKDQPPDPDKPRTPLNESVEVTWLLGSQFQLGVIEGSSGPSEALAGLSTAVLREGVRAIESAWSFRPEGRADLVVAGVGTPGTVAGLDELTRGLATATRLVQRGGKIVLLSRAEGSFGPALRRLAEAGDARAGRSTLRGLEGEADYDAARRISQATAWADVYLLSRLDGDNVEELSMIPLERPEDARRLVAVSHSCVVVGRAEETSAWATDPADAVDG